MVVGQPVQGAMLVTIFTLLVCAWIVLWLFFVKSLKKMGGKIPFLIGPFTIQKMLNEYAVLCRENNKKPVYCFLIYSLFIVILAFVVAMIIIR